MTASQQKLLFYTVKYQTMNDKQIIESLNLRIAELEHKLSTPTPEAYLAGAAEMQRRMEPVVEALREFEQWEAWAFAQCKVQGKNFTLHPAHKSIKAARAVLDKYATGKTES
jgi:hypothetical protein